MSQHTSKLTCCSVLLENGPKITLVYCPLHAAAPRMRDLLVALGECKSADEAHDLIVNQGAILLADIEGKEG